MSRFSYLFILILCAMTIVVLPLVSVAPVLADTTEDSSIGGITDPGILPDSGFYFVKKLSRNFHLMLTGSDAGKAGLMLKYSNEDALALKELYRTGKYDAGAKHAEQYVLQVQNTIQTIAQVRKMQGVNASEELSGKMKQNYLQQQEALLSVMEKAPGTAQNALLSAIEDSNKHVASMIMAQNGEPALLQYQEQVLQQTNNMGEETRIRIQQRLVVVHGQAGQSSDDNSGQNIKTQTQSQAQNQVQNQTDDQMPQQTAQQNGTQSTQNQATGQSFATPDNDIQYSEQGKQQGK